jgi:hypothetical protein
MTTKDFKDKFKQDPESSYISYYLQQFIQLGKSNGLPEYFWKTKNIDEVDDVEELYRIKGQIFLLKTSCAHIIDLIDKLDFHVTEEFDDTAMTPEDIGINTGDRFFCIKDYLHWDMLLIKPGSIIAIDQFRYAGSKSLFTAQLEKLIEHDQNESRFPEPEILPLMLNFKDLRENFKRI